MREPDLIIGTPADPYLRRWWLLPRNKWFNVYLHNFIRSDNDIMHDHQYWNISIVLKGFYLEFLKKDPEPRRPHVRTRGAIVFRRPESAHRIELYPGVVAWTLFVTGPRVREWGFHCPKGWKRWQDFVADGKYGQVGEGCGE